LSTTEVRSHSALHVLKGAVVRMLGPRRTSSATSSGNRGTLTVEIDRNPTAKELWAIEDAANREIIENAEVLQFEMERQEAEGHYGVAIYDSPPDPQVTLLTIVRIPDWEVTCCSAKHVEKTGELAGLTLDRISFARIKGELELEFHIEELQDKTSMGGTTQDSVPQLSG
jgi:alanyl-tRNA synthetase